MTWPITAEVDLRELRFARSHILESGRRLTARAVTTASRSLIREDGSMRLQADLVSAQTSRPGEPLSFFLPVTDQEGWRDAETRDLILVDGDRHTHTYVTTLTIQHGSRILSTETFGPYVLPAGGPIEMDVDLLPSGEEEGVLLPIPEIWARLIADAEAVLADTRGVLAEAEGVRDEAGQHAASASSSADAAAGSALDADAARDAAADEVVAARAARTGAEGARDAAQGHAAVAGTARGGAEAARDAAAGSATAAAGSAAAARGSEQGAAASATAAAASRDAAAGSATAAGTARTGAETARTGAEAAKTAAEAARDDAQATITEAVTRAARPDALKLLGGLLALAPYAPVPLVFAGSSTTQGSAATLTTNRYVNRLVRILQSRFPNGLTESNIQHSSDAVFTPVTTPGIHGYNAGHGGTRANDYLLPQEIERINALAPVMILHMIGANDYTSQRSLAVYKADLLQVIDAIDAGVPTPHVHVLVHPYPRGGWTPPTIPFARYGEAMREIAEASPSNRVFIDLSAAYDLARLSTDDPFDLLSTDMVHQTDRGHAFMAAAIAEALGVNGGISGSTAASESGTAGPAPLSDRYYSDTFTGSGPYTPDRVADLRAGGRAVPLGTMTFTDPYMEDNTLKWTISDSSFRYARLPIAPDLDHQIGFEVAPNGVSATGVLWVGLYMIARSDRVAVRINPTTTAGTYRLALDVRIAGASTEHFPKSVTVGSRLSLRCWQGVLAMIVDGVVVGSMPAPPDFAPDEARWGSNGTTGQVYPPGAFALKALTIDVLA